MLALVTGSTGFIGSQLCGGLLERGWRVRAFHRPDSSLAGLEALQAASEVEHALGDITQPETLALALKGVDTVFHTAAILGRPRRPDNMYRVTVGGTRHLLERARLAGVSRVVHTSSVAALGPPVEFERLVNPDRLHTTLVEGKSPAERGLRTVQIPLIDETHTWNYRPEWWRYGHSKYLAELEVQRAVAQGLDVVITNPAIVIGAGDLNRVSGDILLKVAKRQIPVAIEGGLNVIHIADVVRGHLAALERGRTGHRYILAAENMTITHFLELVAQEAGVPAPRLVLSKRLVRSLATPWSMASRLLPMPVSGEILHQAGYFFYYNNTKARDVLGLEDLRPAAEAIRAALDWYRGRGDLK